MMLTIPNKPNNLASFLGEWKKNSNIPINGINKLIKANNNLLFSFDIIASLLFELL